MSWVDIIRKLLWQKITLSFQLCHRIQYIFFRNFKISPFLTLHLICIKGQSKVETIYDSLRNYKLFAQYFLIIQLWREMQQVFTEILSYFPRLRPSITFVAFQVEDKRYIAVSLSQWLNLAEEIIFTSWSNNLWFNLICAFEESTSVSNIIATFSSTNKVMKQNYKDLNLWFQ